MPRKPKPPMPMIIEGLSDRRQRAVDDFTGEAIDLPNLPPIPTANELYAMRKRQARLEAAQLLSLVAPRPKPRQVPLIPQGKRIVYDKQGKPVELAGKTMLVDLPKWRRV